VDGAAEETSLPLLVFLTFRRGLWGEGPAIVIEGMVLTRKSAFLLRYVVEGESFEERREVACSDFLGGAPDGTPKLRNSHHRPTSTMN
jgi:hypothetical protein